MQLSLLGFKALSPPSWSLLKGILFLSIALSFLIFTFGFLKINHLKLKDNDFLLRYNSLYLSVNTGRQYSQLAMSFFLVRRLCLASFIVFLEEYPVFQIWFIMASASMMIFYVIKVRPYNEKLINYIEIFNEIIILACCIFAHAFTDYNSDQLN